MKNSLHANNLLKWLVRLNLLDYCYHVYFFLEDILKYVKPRTTFYLIRWAGPPGLQLYGWWKQAGSVSCDQKFFLKFFQTVSLKVLSHLPGDLAPYNQLLILPLLLVSDAFLHEMQKLRFWNFETILFRINF